MQQFMSQLQQMFSAPTSGGPVNWELARQVAQAHLTGSKAAPAGMFGFGMPMMAPAPTNELPEAETPVGDPSVTAAERAEVVEALKLADLWLEPESELPSGLTVPTAWSRGEWLAATLDVWRKLC